MEKLVIFEQVKRIFAEGGVVAIPTETVYGLAAPIGNPEGIKKIFAIKERPFFDPLIVHISSTKQVTQVVEEWPQIAQHLAEKFWPGPLTMVLPKNKNINNLITSGLDTVGIRMPNHSLALNLIEFLDTPLAAPSANKFGKTSPTQAAHVKKNFPEIFVIDGGPCVVGVESTVIKLEQKKIIILRQGMITEAQLKDALDAVNFSVSITLESNSSLSPGHTKDHYQPEKPLLIIEDESELKLIRKNTRAGEIILGDNPIFAARTLYAQFYELDSNLLVDQIYVFRQEKNSSQDWRAIWDRLERARKK